ncbi:MAG TPA: T9SS type A sorting domain-containing protein [Chitinophagaceae bacterium]|nr:T9SS type A sorting domain-containing protein [Chitinophagaceae bacterium]
MRRILPILSIILLTAFYSQGQVTRPTPSPDAMEKIVKLYPNPANSYVNFDLQKTADKGLSIQVYNFLGRKMYENQNVTDRTTIDVSEYNRGVYIYHLRDQAGKIIESGKFQVTH